MTFAKRLAEARRTAARWHAGQTYGHHPYTMHLDEVLAVALQYEIEDEDILLATRFHDAIEDVEGITPQTIVATTGNTRVALLAWAVTNEEGKNRKVRAKKTYPKIAGIPGATILKLCDRIANTRNCWLEAERMDANKRNRSKLGMYRSEYPGFRKALRRAEVEGPERLMWNELDRLFAWAPVVGEDRDYTLSMSDFQGTVPPILESLLD